MVPEIRMSSYTKPRGPYRWKVKATGQILDAVAGHGQTGSPLEYRTVAGELNVHVVNLADQETGEIRTYLASAVEPVDVE